MAEKKLTDAEKRALMNQSVRQMKLAASMIANGELETSLRLSQKAQAGLAVLLAQ